MIEMVKLSHKTSLSRTFSILHERLFYNVAEVNSFSSSIQIICFQVEVNRLPRALFIVPGDVNRLRACALHHARMCTGRPRRVQIATRIQALFTWGEGGGSKARC